MDKKSIIPSEVANNSLHYTNVTAKVQRGWRKVREWYTSSYATRNAGDYEPAWVSARRSNLATAIFCQLPEELILQIMHNLDHVSKAMAMRTCGLFLRIMFDRTLYSHGIEFHSSADFQVWPPLEPPFRDLSYKARLALQQQVKRLLDRDRFCDPCRRFREDGRYERAVAALQATIWCSHCETTHKRPFFSPQQRAASSATRVCILGQGMASVCAHMSVKLDSAQSTVSSRKTFRKEKCRHPEHHVAWYTRLKDVITTDSGPLDERPHLEFAHLSDDDHLPTDISSKTIMRLCRLRHAVPVTREWLHQRLTENAHMIDTMSCPHVRAGDGQLLLAFSPSSCGCFDRNRLVDNASCVGAEFCLCCRCYNLRKARPATYFMSGHFCFLQHEYRCAICDASYSWLRNGSAVYLQIGKLSYHDLRCPKQSTPSSELSQWLHKIDPETWGILDDEELHRVAWCEDINCASRWRWKRLSRLLDH